MSDELPAGWTRGSLSSLLSLRGLMSDGDWVESKDQDPEGDVRLVQLADVGNGKFLDKSGRYLTKARARELHCTFLEGGDVLISRLGDPLGKSCLFPALDLPCVTVVDVHVFRSGSADVSHGWLVHWLNSPSIRSRIEFQSSGTTRTRITGQKLKDLEVPVPPSNEQQRIVSKIDELFSRIEEGERALERVQKLVERYRQSVLKAAVTGELTREWREQRKGQLESGEALLQRILKARREAWEQSELDKMKAKDIQPTNDKWKRKYEEPTAPDTTNLPELPSGWVWASMDQVGFVSGGLTKNRQRKEREHQRPYLRVANVYANRLDLDEVLQIGVSESELDRVLLKSGDLLVVEGNGSLSQIGRVALWDGSIPGCVHQNHLIKVRCTSDLPSWYLLIWCMSPLGRQAIQRVASSTAGLHTLSISKIQALPVPIPSADELSMILDRFDQMDSLVANQLEALGPEVARAGALRQSVLRVAFNGALVSQEVDDEPASALINRLAVERGQSSLSVTRRREKAA